MNRRIGLWINRANQELTCFPSVGTIAKECNISTRTVQRALNNLEEAGFLERKAGSTKEVVKNQYVSYE